MAHPSDSTVQQQAEAEILVSLSARLGTDLKTASLVLPNGARVLVDGAAQNNTVFVEVFAHQGRLKGAQPKKVAHDALKLITLQRSYPDARLILAFADETAAACVKGKSWLAEALETWSVEVEVVELSAETKQRLQEAQLRQVMVNPPLESDPP